jgi:uncharacterized RDD family membrane protein YckC
MFIIIGGDGKEYGPVSADQIRGWVAAGRANLDTQAKRAGTEEWQRLGDFDEFAPPAEPPPLVGVIVEDSTLAGLGPRFLGAFVDGALETACWIPTAMAVGRQTAEMVRDNALHPEELMKLFFEAIPLSLPYLGALVLLQAILLSVRGQSVGNLVARTRIVNAKDGRTAHFLRAFLLRGCLARILRQFPFVGGVFWIVDVCFVFRNDRRCVHDLIAGTKVIKAQSSETQLPS